MTEHRALEGGGLIEIIVLAMLAGFIALRLVSVLGRRTGHENPVGEGYSRTRPEMEAPGGPVVDARPLPPTDFPSGLKPELQAPLSAIAASDPNFQPRRFVDGAKAAYALILDAFWKGDTAALDGLVSDDVALQFGRAIEARKAEKLSVDNRLVRINQAEIVGAQLSGSMAEVTVRFDADIAATTRNANGDIVAGSSSDAVPTHDLWTFSRHVGASDPNWLLIATDEPG